MDGQIIIALGVDLTGQLFVTRLLAMERVMYIMMYISHYRVYVCVCADVTPQK